MATVYLENLGEFSGAKAETLKRIAAELRKLLVQMPTDREDYEPWISDSEEHSHEDITQYLIAVRGAHGLDPWGRRSADGGAEGLLD